MKITIDLKSALCGMIIGILAMLLSGFGTSSNPVGKYKVATGVSDGKGYAIMIDTQTGQAWGYEAKPSQMTRVGYMDSVDFWKEK